VKAFIAFALLVCIAVDAQAASWSASWSDLWLNRDQQGQRLLEAGKAAEAARTFNDARHRAYAQIQAGQYQDAAKQLQAFDDAESHYNRGNALARDGKLKESLAAYDQAIKQAPADSAVSRDAQHNRELVAQQLRKQQPPQSSSSDGNQSQSGGDASADNRQESSQSGKQSSGESGDHNSAGGSQTQSAQHDSRAQDSQGKSAAQQQASAQPHGGSANSSSQSQPSSETNSQDAAQARRDAEASLAQDKQDKQEADAAKQPITAQSAAQGEHGEDAGSPPAISEQALALDQWLRQIPDDPSGLLRRKFLIEHLRRQRESQR